jgi:hypothetical protein
MALSVTMNELLAEYREHSTALTAELLANKAGVRQLEKRVEELEQELLAAQVKISQLEDDQN